MSDFETIVEIIYLTLTSRFPKSVKNKLLRAGLESYAEIIKKIKTERKIGGINLETKTACRLGGGMAPADAQVYDMVYTG